MKSSTPPWSRAFHPPSFSSTLHSVEQNVLNYVSKIKEIKRPLRPQGGSKISLRCTKCKKPREKNVFPTPGYDFLKITICLWIHYAKYLLMPQSLLRCKRCKHPHEKILFLAWVLIFFNPDLPVNTVCAKPSNCDTEISQKVNSPNSYEQQTC